MTSDERKSILQDYKQAAVVILQRSYQTISNELYMYSLEDDYIISGYHQGNCHFLLLSEQNIWMCLIFRQFSLFKRWSNVKCHSNFCHKYQEGIRHSSNANCFGLWIECLFSSLLTVHACWYLLGQIQPLDAEVMFCRDLVVFSGLRLVIFLVCQALLMLESHWEEQHSTMVDSYLHK